MSKAEAAAVELADGEAPKKGGKGKLIIIAVLALVLVGGGVGGFLFWKSKQGDGHEKHAEEPKPVLPLQFVPLDPPFVVNFTGQQTVRFLQVEVRLSSREGKEKLRAAALEQVRKIVKTEGGKPESVDNVYFTSFVMQ